MLEFFPFWNSSYREILWNYVTHKFEKKKQNGSVPNQNQSFHNVSYYKVKPNNDIMKMELCQINVKKKI